MGRLRGRGVGRERIRLGLRGVGVRSSLTSYGKLENKRWISDPE